MIQRQVPDPLPRAVILCASLWLVISWLMTIGAETPMEPSWITWQLRLRLLLMSCILGAMIAWPMAMLCRRTPGTPGTVLRCVIMLVVLMQLAIWPASGVAAIPMSTMVVLDASLVAWLLLIGAFTAWGLLDASTWTRCIAMIGCLAAVLISVLPSIQSPDSFFRFAGPLTLTWDLVGHDRPLPPPGVWIQFSIVATVATLAWIIRFSISAVSTCGHGEGPSG